MFSKWEVGPRHGNATTPAADAPTSRSTTDAMHAANTGRATRLRSAQPASRSSEDAPPPDAASSDAGDVDELDRLLMTFLKQGADLRGA